jgi:hypothetical protein
MDRDDFIIAVFLVVCEHCQALKRNIGCAEAVLRQR